MTARDKAIVPPNGDAPRNKLKVLRIERPCSIRMEEMATHPEGWFCAHCEKSVYNLSELTAFEARLLYVAKRGKLCGRLYFDANGSTVFRKINYARSMRKRLLTPIIQSALVVTLSACGSERVQGRADGGRAHMGTADSTAAGSDETCAQQSAGEVAKGTCSSFWDIQHAEAQGGGPAEMSSETFGEIECDQGLVERIMSFVLGRGVYVTLASFVALGMLLCSRWARRLWHFLRLRLSRRSD